MRFLPPFAAKRVPVHTDKPLKLSVRSLVWEDGAPQPTSAAAAPRAARGDAFVVSKPLAARCTSSALLKRHNSNQKSCLGIQTVARLSQHNLQMNAEYSASVEDPQNWWEREPATLVRAEPCKDTS